MRRSPPVPRGTPCQGYPASCAGGRHDGPTEGHALNDLLVGGRCPPKPSPWAGSSPSRTRRAASARPPPPSTSPRPSPPPSGARCWSTSTRRATPAAASGVRRDDVASKSIYDVLLDGRPLAEVIRQTELQFLDVVPATRGPRRRRDRAGRARRAASTACKRAVDPRGPELRLHPHRLPAVARPAHAERAGRRRRRAHPAAVRVLRARGARRRCSRTIELVQGRLNPGLEVEGILLTMFDARNNLAHQVADEVRGALRRAGLRDRHPAQRAAVARRPASASRCCSTTSRSKGCESYLALAAGSDRAASSAGRQASRDHGRQAPRPAPRARDGRPALERGAAGERRSRMPAARGRRRRAPCSRCPSRRWSRTPTSPASTSTSPASRSSPRPSRSTACIQPILVRRRRAGYRIIAGERRWRAAQRAGLHEIPAVVREASRPRGLRARAGREPPARGPEPHRGGRGLPAAGRRALAHAGAARRRVGKDRSTVANALRLLKLPEPSGMPCATGSSTWATPAPCSGSRAPRPW